MYTEREHCYLDDDDLLVEHLLLAAVPIVVVEDDCGRGDPPGDVVAQVACALQRELRRRQLSGRRKVLAGEGFLLGFDFC